MKGLSSSQILQMQREKLKEQDTRLDEIDGLLRTSKQNNREMSNEIDKQNPIINNLDKQMDKVDNKIKRTQIGCSKPYDVLTVQIAIFVYDIDSSTFS